MKNIIIIPAKSLKNNNNSDREIMFEHVLVKAQIVVEMYMMGEIDQQQRRMS